MAFAALDSCLRRNDWYGGSILLGALSGSKEAAEGVGQRGEGGGGYVNGLPTGATRAHVVQVTF